MNTRARELLTVAAVVLTPLLSAAGAWGGSGVRLEAVERRAVENAADIRRINEEKLPALVGRVIVLETKRSQEHER